MYPSLVAAKEAVAAVGQRVAEDGLRAGVGPLTFAFTATGNVSQGAQEIFKLLPHEMVSCDDLQVAAEEGSLFFLKTLSSRNVLLSRLVELHCGRTDLLHTICTL